MKVRSINPKIQVLNKRLGNQTLELGKFYKKVVYRNQIADGQQPGMFQIELLPKANDQFPSYSNVDMMNLLLKVIDKRDIISIGIKRPGSFIGRIEDISEGKAYTKQGHQHSIILSGRSFGSCLIDDIVYFAPELVTNEKALKVLGDQRNQYLGILKGFIGEANNSTFINKHPFCAILWILYNMPAMNINVDYSSYSIDGAQIETTKRKIGQFFRVKFIGHVNDEIFDLNLSQFANGSIYNFIMRCLDTAFYEIFVETVTRDPDTNELLKMPQPCIFIRPKPFDRTNREKLLKDTTDIRDFPFSSFKIDKQTEGLTEEEQLSQNSNVSTPKIKQIAFLNPDKEKLKKLNWLWDGDTDYLTLRTKQPFHTINNSDVIPEEFRTQTVRNNVNYYYMTSSKDIFAGSVLAAYGYLFPLIDGDSVPDNGMRGLIGQSNLRIADDTFKGLNNETTQVSQSVSSVNYYATTTGYKTRRNRLYHWNRINDILYNGSITIVGNEDICVGDKIFFADEMTFKGNRGMYYYTRAVTHECSVDSGFKTRIERERGQNPKEIQKFEDDHGHTDFDNGIESEKNKIITSDIGEVKEPTPTYAAGNNVDDTNDQSVAEGQLTNDAREYIKGRFDKFRSEYTAQGIGDYKALCKIIEKSSANIGLNPHIILGLMVHESIGLDPYAKNPKSSATGIGQFLNASAEGEGLKVAKSNGKYLIRGSAKNNVPRSAILSYANVDDRFNPRKVIPAICSHLQSKGWHRGGDSRRLKTAIKRYGENTESYYSAVRNKIKKFFPNFSG